MQIVTNETQLHVTQSKDPELNIAQGYLEALLGDLLYLPEIMSPSEFVLEYSAILSESASFIIGAHDAMVQIRDPAVLKSAAYKTLLADLTTKTDPSLYEAAKNSNPLVLASLLLSLKGEGNHGFNISELEGAINAFDRL